LRSVCCLWEGSTVFRANRALAASLLAVGVSAACATTPRQTADEPGPITRAVQLPSDRDEAARMAAIRETCLAASR
jgi:hypothetical protein